MPTSPTGAPGADGEATWVPISPTGKRKTRAAVGRLAALVRRRWVALAVVAALLVAAAAGLGVWGLGDGGSHGAGSTTGPPAGNLTPADVALLKVMPPNGYNRANCTHHDPDSGADAVLACQKNPIVGAPSARFLHFPNRNAMAAAYRTATADSHATNCPGDTPGPDGPRKLNDKEVGRRACYTDNSVTPPAPSSVITNYAPAVMEVFTWTDPGGLDALTHWSQHGLNAVVQDTPGKDPDFFTPADVDLLNTLDAAMYGKANCRHAYPPSAQWKATVECLPNLVAGAPEAQFLAHLDPESALNWYDKMAKAQSSAPHRCGGGAGSDDAWLDHEGQHVGRYFCVTEPSTGGAAGVEFGTDRPGLVASNERRSTVVEFIADPPDSTYQLPKSEQALADWFTNTFTP